MKQLIQNFKSGELYVDDVPPPSLTPGFVLVANSFSLISAGTEKSTVSVGQASLLGKAKQRPDLVKQVMANIKREGLLATVTKVRTKIESLKALGYSTCGVVLASMDSNVEFSPGTRVACAGQDYASHAEVVSVPQNLVVRVPDSVSDQEAAFTTVGAIALQGVRQADPKIGDHVAVIGLGLIGQLTCQILRANGCNVFGIDVSERMVGLAKTISADDAMTRNDQNLVTRIDAFTMGHGFDTVIITAGAQSNDPIELAGEILKKKGTVVVVGAVKMDLPRDPHYYRKEISLKLSCSYGPGRYDTQYEGEGIDYPYAYVRYTEKRNMEAFLRLLEKKALNLIPLITHTFDITDANAAYDMVLGNNPQPYIGILLQYPKSQEKNESIITCSPARTTSNRIGFIGAGSFAQSYLIPNIDKTIFSLDTVMTRTGVNAKSVATKFGFTKCTTDSSDILCNTSIQTVFIATQHDSHGQYVLEALRAQKHVFVEKPLCLSLVELEEIRNEVRKNPHLHLMVGFNRRFSSAAIKARSLLSSGGPVAMQYRVNAGFLPKDHWTQTPAGGGRILGEVCHFVDLAQYICDAAPVEVYAKRMTSISSSIKDDDNVHISIAMSNGSIANIAYLANGPKSMPKENIEAFSSGKSFVINDFRDAIYYSPKGDQKISCSGKGHREEVRAFLDAIHNGTQTPISFESIYLTTLTTYKILDALNTGLPQRIEIPA